MWSQIFIGWPAILGSLGLSAAGIATGRAFWPIYGAVLSTGFGWLYLVGSPLIIFQVTGVALPFLHLAAGYCVLRGWRRAAWLFLLPQAAIASYFGLAVLLENY